MVIKFKNSRGANIVIMVILFALIFVCNSFAQIPDSLANAYRINGLSFGYKWENHYLYYPIHVNPSRDFPDSLNKILESVLSAPKYKDGDDYYVSLPFKYFPDYYLDHAGDTLTMMWANNRNKAVVNEFGYQAGFCANSVVCDISPLDSINFNHSEYFSFIALRHSDLYEAYSIPFKKYQLSDSLHKWLADTLQFLFTWNKDIYTDSIFRDQLYNAKTRVRYLQIENKYNEWSQKEHLNYNHIYLSICGQSQEFLPESLFVAAFEDTFQVGKFALYLFYPNDSKYVKPIIPISDWEDIGVGFDIECAFDLNNDGILEYLVEGELRSAIYTFINGHLVRVKESEYRGCP